MIRLRRMAALLLAASLFAPAARAATRIEGDYQLMMELRKTGRTYPWDWDSNSYDTYDNASFRIFSQPRQGVEAFVKFEGDWNPSDNSGTRNVLQYREAHLRFRREMGKRGVDTYLFSRQDRFYVDTYLIPFVYGRGDAQGLRLDTWGFGGMNNTVILADQSGQFNPSDYAGLTPHQPLDSLSAQHALRTDDMYIVRSRREFGAHKQLRLGLTFNRYEGWLGRDSVSAAAPWRSVVGLDSRIRFGKTDVSIEYGESRSSQETRTPGGRETFSVFKHGLGFRLPDRSVMQAEIRSLRLGTARTGYLAMTPGWWLTRRTNVLAAEWRANKWSATLAGLAVGVAVGWAVTALATVAVGRIPRVGFGPSASLYFAASLVASAAVFTVVGAVTSQLAASRRQAAALAAVVLGASYGVRLVADAGMGAEWARWLSPLGWVEELGPLTGPRPLAFVPIVACCLVLGGLAVVLAGRRDVGASVLAERTPAGARLAGLSGPAGLTWRQGRGVYLGWVGALAAIGLLYGLVARSASRSIGGSSLSEVLRRLGAQGSGIEAMLGVVFLVLAVTTGFAAAGQITSAQGELTQGRAAHLLVRSVSRQRWLWTRVVMAAGFVVVLAVAAAAAVWIGGATQHAGMDPGRTLAAGLNTIPPCLVVLGAGVAGLGLWPRRAAAVAYTVLLWSLLVELVGGIGGLDRWLYDASLFHQMAAAPAVSPDPTSAAVLVALAIGLAGAGAWGFGRRDIDAG